MTHVTSLLAISRIEASLIIREQSGNKGWYDYYITGITHDSGEDLSSYFPHHIRDRIKNKGVRMRKHGYLYQYIKKA